MVSEFYFELKDTAIFQAVKLEKYFRFDRFLKKVFFVFFIFTLLIVLYGLLSENISGDLLSRILGLSIISLTLTIAFGQKLAFFNLKLKKPKLKYSLNEAVSRPEKINLAEFLSFEVAKAVYKSIRFSRAKKFPEINSSILFYFMISGNPKLNFVFSRAILNIVEIKKILKAHLSLQKSTKFEKNFSGEFRAAIFESFKIAQKKGNLRIEIGDMITALSQYDLIFKKILVDADLKVEDIENLTWWLESIEEKIAERKKFWEYRNLARKGSLAKEWSAGYTLTLDKYSIDWTDYIKQKGFEEIIGHQDTIEQVERALSRTEFNNVLLIGEPGSGRGSIIQALAQKSLFGESFPNLNYKRVVELDIPSLLAQFENSEEVEAILDKIFREVIYAGNIILVINEFHNFVGQLARPGIIDISGVLVPFLKFPQLQIVAITTFVGLHRYIEQNPSVLSLFGKVEVSEISAEETIRLLENLALALEQKYKKFISYPALRETVNYSKRYMPTIPFPKKALDLLDEIMVYLVRSTTDKVLLPEHVAKIISKKVQVPVGELELKEKELLLNLEVLIHQRIINQEEAVNEVSAALRRARTEVTVRKGPMGCFLFMGPTGVGKTETSKALAEIYFGSEEKMIRLDMSEFQAIGDIPRLIGASEEEGLLTTAVRENPFSLILLDEIEKSHPNVLNLFLQVLDEGHLTDGQGQKVDFKNSIIIATSNAGYQVILEAIKRGKPMSEIKDELLDFLFKEGIFRPEFINRFDAVVVFKNLSKENLLDIAELLLRKLKEGLEKKGIEFIVTEPLKERIVELGYSPIFGARQMRRVIQDNLENVLASAVLSDQLKKGDRVEVEPHTFQLLINK